MAEQMERIVEHSTSIFTPAGYCHRCEHLYRVKMGCKAFPDGIPSNILLGHLPHEVPYPQQSGDFVYTEED